MNLHVIDTGHFKLDGGAMFGVVPKALWNIACNCVAVKSEMKGGKRGRYIWQTSYKKELRT